MGILVNRKIIPLERIPRIVGIGSFIFGFLFLMIYGLTNERPAEIVADTTRNFILAAAIAFGGYI